MKRAEILEQSSLVCKLLESSHTRLAMEKSLQVDELLLLDYFGQIYIEYIGDVNYIEKNVCEFLALARHRRRPVPDESFPLTDFPSEFANLLNHEQQAIFGAFGLITALERDTAVVNLGRSQSGSTYPLTTAPHFLHIPTR